MRETIAVFGAALLGASALTWGGVAHAQQIAPFFSSQGDPSAPGRLIPTSAMEWRRATGRSLAAPTQAFELQAGGRVHAGLRERHARTSAFLRLPAPASAATWTSTTG